MITRNRGELVCECADCGTKAYGGTAEWSKFIDNLKEDGWNMRKDGDEWLHQCPECAKS